MKRNAHGKSFKRKNDPKTVESRKSRKELRKDIRHERKLKRSHQYRLYLRKSGNMVPQPAERPAQTKKESVKSSKLVGSRKLGTVSEVEVQHSIEKKEQNKLQCDMQKGRKRLLLAANEDEDRNIRKLEKMLKLDKHKRKSLPKSFVEDGLSYLLDVCNPDTLKESAKVEEVLYDSGSDFEEDLAVVKGSSIHNSNRTMYYKKNAIAVDHSQEKSDTESEKDTEFESDSDKLGNHNFLGRKVYNSRQFSEDDCTSDSEKETISMEKKAVSAHKIAQNSKKNKLDKHSPSKSGLLTRKHKESDGECSQTSSILDDVSDSNSIDGSDSEDNVSDVNSLKLKEDSSHTANMWEDIYGRTRGKDGNIIEEKPQKYVPPALRAKMLEDTDSTRREHLLRLKKQIKGLINRLSENNMASISTQIDDMYMTHSRHDMNSTLLEIFMEALVSPVLTPERLVMEHILLISILHANVGTEVGAYFLQNFIKRFQDSLDANPAVENKEIDNIVLILSHLYNFKVFHASLLFEVLGRIAEVLNEKRIELLLVVLRSVGFALRKDDPVALKDLIIKLQNAACNNIDGNSTSSRMKFMLDILLAIKNNNMSKIPSYDPYYIEHLRKVLRTLLRRGNFITELKISLDDLLKVEERGRWWIVGSAWTGHLPGENPGTLQCAPVKSTSVFSSSYSAKLLELARKQRMNTGIRKDIFCILMSAEDYMDAFEKLIHLCSKNQQKNEIVHVLIDCCLQEKTFNPYYAHLAQRFCDFDRQFQITLQYCLWDKLKEIDEQSHSQISNMAQFLAHLFLEKGLPLSVLKVLSFGEMGKACVRFVRQVILAVLLSKDRTASEAVFQRIAASPKLHLFREGLRLFISHFIVHKSHKKVIPDSEASLLQERVKAADKALSAANAKIEF